MTYDRSRCRSFEWFQNAGAPAYYAIVLELHVVLEWFQTEVGVKNLACRRVQEPQLLDGVPT